MIELKPCPFCGKQAEIFHGDQDTSFGSEAHVVAMCASCGIRTPKFFYIPELEQINIAEEMVAKRWNRGVQE